MTRWRHRFSTMLGGKPMKINLDLLLSGHKTIRDLEVKDEKDLDELVEAIKEGLREKGFYVKGAFAYSTDNFELFKEY